jgi:hypothetical protein
LRGLFFRGIQAKILAPATLWPRTCLSREVPAMNVKVGNGKSPEDIEDDLESEEDSDEEVLSDEDDEDVENVGDISVEINVEELVAKLARTDSEDVVRRREIRRRLEELREQREAQRDLDSTFNFNLDDDQ